MSTSVKSTTVDAVLTPTVRTQRDASSAPAELASMETDSTAGVNSVLLMLYNNC